jgi:hypothetical protein
MSMAPQEPQKSGMSVIMIVLIVLGVMFLGCMGVCGGCYYVGTQAMKEAMNAIELVSPSLEAQTAISDNAEVDEKLGKELTWGPPMRADGKTGELNTSNTPFTMQVTGPKGTAVAHIRAAQKDGDWKVLEIKVKLASGETIDVPPPPDAPPQLNFDLKEPTESDNK